MTRALTDPRPGANPNSRNTSPAKLKERDITRTVRDYLELRGWRPIRYNAGPFGPPGVPDYIFVHYARRLFIWIEFKSPTGRPSAAQLKWIEAERARGATVLVVGDVDAFIVWYESAFGEEGQRRLAL